MTITSKTKRGWCSVFIASALAASAAGETRSQQLTLDQLARMSGPDAGEFPLVHGTRTLRARFQEKRIYTVADGSRQTLFVFRAAGCWLKERTAVERAAIDCTGSIGPGVFIPVLFVTPPSSKQRLDRPPPDLVLRSRYRNSLADFIPEELLDGPRPYDPSRSIWIRLINPEAESLSLSAPAAPAALVLCVPVAAGECETRANAQLANLAGPAGQPVIAAQPPPPAVRPPPAPVTPAPVQPPPSGGVAQATPVTPITPAPPRPSAGEILASPAAPIPPPATAQLHYVIRPAAGATLPDWTPARMAKRLVTLLASTQSEFFLKTRDSGELRSSLAPELTGGGDAVVVWSGDNPQGSSEFIFRGVGGLELLPWTQPAEAQPTSATLASPRIRATDYISFAEYRIATPYLYEQWQAGIEAVTKVYGREQPYSLTESSCRFSLLIPKAGWISFLTGPNIVGLERTEQAGRNILLSRPVITPADLMHGAGEPLQLEVQSASEGHPCASERINLAAFGAAAGNAWKLSSVVGNPSTGRMDIRTPNLPTPGRWLLGLYGPQNVAAGTEGAAGDAQTQIFNFLTVFLENFNARHFENGQTATGADLALISAADAVSPIFLEKNVIVGKFRQPPPQGGLFRLDPEGNSRLSAFLSGPSNTGADVSFRSVGQMIRHYSDLFGNLSALRPPIAVYVGAARPVPGTCPEWKKMTADIAKLPGRPRVFAIAFANAGTDEIARQLGENGHGAEEILGGQTRALTCDGDGGSTLMFVPFPHLVLGTPEAVLGPAFEAVERWATKVQN